MDIAANALPLQTLSPELKPPSKRVANAADAQTIVHSIMFANRERARFNAKVKGMLDGNPPYNQAKLQANAQSYRSNFNPLEGDAILSAALVPYYDLFAGSQFYAEVKLNLDNPDDRDFKSGVVTEEFDLLLKSYTGFIPNMHMLLHDFVAFGRGFVTWASNWGWHFQHASYSKVFVTDTTRAELGKVDILVVREKYELHRLWGYIKDKKTATDLGWDTEATAKAIRYAMPEERASYQGDVLSYDYIQQRMRDRDLAESQSGGKQPTVQVCHLLVKEFDGSITHMTVLEPGTVQAPASQSGTDPQPQFLYAKQKKYDNFRQYMAAFFFETLDGSWNGSRGLGHKIYAAMEVKAKLINKAMDNAFISSSITLQAIDANSQQKAGLVQFGNINLLPPGFNVQPGSIFANSAPLYDANNLLDQTVTSNTGIYRAKLEKPKGNPVTATEAEFKFQNATVLSNSGVARFYQQLDPCYAELYRRVTDGFYPDTDKSEEAEAVRRFLYCCKKRGVTKEELKKVLWVRAMRNIGNGSQFQRTQDLEEFTPFVQLLPESGRVAWMDMLIAAKFGQGAVDRLNPQRDRQLLPNDQMAWAALENAAMKEGAQPVWTPTQNNVIHATEHLKAMSAAAGSLEQGGDPMTALSFLEIAGPHVQLHLDKLASDPSRKTELKMLSQQFGQLASFTDQLAAEVERQQEEQAQQQQAQVEAQARAQAIQNGTDPEAAVKQALAQNDIQIKQAKAAQQLQSKAAQLRQREEAHRQSLAAKDLETAQKLRAAQADIEIRKAQAREKTNTPTK